LFISQKYKIIFFHIPKTAGTTITNILFKYFNDYNFNLKNVISNNFKKIVEKEKLEVNELYNSKTWPPIHINQTKIKKVLELSQINTNNFFEFVVVRNPYDRLISLYNYTPNTMTFDELLDVYEKNINIDSYFNFWFKSQMSWVSEPLSKKLNIFKYEEIDKCWDFLKERINLDIHFPHVNVSKNKYISDLSVSQKDRIYHLFKDEFDILGYDR